MLRELQLLNESPLGIVLIGIALTLMALRTVTPWARRVEGRTLRRLPVPVLARIRRQWLPIGLLAAVSLVDAFTDWVTLLYQSVALAIAVVFLSIPTRSVITDEGVRVGWTPFRRWTEFAGVNVRRGNILLQPISGLARLEIALPGRFDDAEVVSELRLLIRTSYQGARHLERDSAASDEEHRSPPLAIA